MSAANEPIMREVRRTIVEHGMLKETKKLVLAVSGGPDSVALFAVFLLLKEEFGLSLTLAHFNHGLRGKESDADEKFVQRLAEENRIPCMVGKTGACQLGPGRGLSLEDAARRLRFRFLDETFERLGADRIALGHTADDQAETVMMRLLRGAGATGLRGILPVREVRYIRPLLNIWRHQILKFLSERNLSFREDRSNRDLRFLRNRMRHQLLPLLSEQYNPRIKERLVSLANILTEEDRYLDRVLDGELASLVVDRKSGKVVFARGPFLALDRAMRFRALRWALQQVGGSLDGIGYRHLIQALDVIEGPRPSKRIIFPRGLILERGYESFAVKKTGELEKAIPSTYSYPLRFPGATRIPEAGLTLVADIKKPEEVKLPLTCSMVACLDLARLGPSLRVRSIRPGDRFQPLGMRGRKKLQDLLVDAKVPRCQRGVVPVVAAGKEIVWVVGHRIAEQFKVTPATRDILRLEVLP